MIMAEQLEHQHGFLQELFEQFFHWLLPSVDGVADFLSDFAFDLIRTGLVFLVVLYLVSYAKTYLSTKRVRECLLRVNRFAAILIATVAGVLSSTCVCTNVPIFLGFLAFGVPLSLSMTYLISSSLINIASIISMWALCGWQFTLSYLVASLLIIVIAGCLLSLLSEKEYLMGSFSSEPLEEQLARPTQKERFCLAWHELVHTAREQWLWILLGVALSVVIEAFADISFAAELSSLGFWGVLFATLIGVVLHTDIIAIVPVLGSLLELHVSYGLLFSLTSSLSFFAIPTVVMLKKAVRVRYILYSWLILFLLILIAGTVLLPFSQ